MIYQIQLYFSREIDIMLHILKLPPLHFITCIAGMYLIRQHLPTSPMTSQQLNTIAGVAFAMLGMIIMGLSAYKFYQHRTNIEAFREPTNLITTGIFTLTRNPIYLGFLIILVGATFYLNQVSGFTFVGIFFLLADRWYIPHEERDAERIFGGAFTTYQARVRRWL